MDANRGTAKANVHDVNARHRRMAKRETSSGLDDHNRVAPFWVLFAPAASAANAWNPPKLPAPPKAVVVDLKVRRTPFVERRRGLLLGPTPHFKGGALMKASSSSSRTRAQVERVLLSRRRRRRRSINVLAKSARSSRSSAWRTNGGGGSSSASSSSSSSSRYMRYARYARVILCGGDFGPPLNFFSQTPNIGYLKRRGDTKQELSLSLSLSCSYART